MEEEKSLFFSMHECSEKLDDDALRDIAAPAALVRNEPGGLIHHADDPLASVYLVV